MQLIFHMNVKDVPFALCVGEVAWSLQGVLDWLKYSGQDFTRISK